jgi:hypothetical protein
VNAAVMSANGPNSPQGLRRGEKLLPVRKVPGALDRRFIEYIVELTGGVTGKRRTLTGKTHTLEARLNIGSRMNGDIHIRI